MTRHSIADMPEVTLLMIQRLDDFENYLRGIQGKSAPPESSQEVQLRNIIGCTSALKSHIVMYRELCWKRRKTG